MEDEIQQSESYFGAVLRLEDGLGALSRKNYVVGPEKTQIIST